ncbi:uncharacterized protein [Miscanthus floridulus]|uniref:uncharacterized protein n=1 Tax=Miscanthus floridulus TaxID=154761 RepID=UPI003459EAF6
MASYHLTGDAQTWYYALEQDEGQPPWDRFKDLCRLRFGPPIRGTRLAELGRLPFYSTVDEFAGRFQAVLAHARDISTRQKAELFVGGLPDHLRVDVEMHDPGDLQMAMYLARTFKRKATALMAPAQRVARPPQRQTPSARSPAGGGTPAGAPAPTAPSPTSPATPTRTFRRLTPAEMLERRRQGLCYNCDEQYVRAHICPRVFYLESSDYIDNDAFTGAETATDAAAEDHTAPLEGATANALVVSVYALAGIRTYYTMLLPVTINGERLLALLDTGSTHTFLQSTVMRRLGIVPHGGNNLRVTVANGERLPCEGIARDLPVLIGGESFPVTCVGLALGCFDFILSVDFLGALGPLLWDFEGLTVSFQRGDQRVTWQCMGAPGASTHQQHLAAATPDQQRPLLDKDGLMI